MKKGILFAIGFGIGAMMFLISGINWAPASPNCAGCTTVHPGVHRSRCNETPSGQWICETP
jgi:hypothetical protein